MEKTLFSYDSPETLVRRASIQRRPGIIAAQPGMPPMNEERYIFVLTWLSPGCKPCSKPLVGRIRASQCPVQETPVLIYDILRNSGMSRNNHPK